MTGPGTSEVVTAQNMATLNPLAPTGREYITGTFGFVLTSNNQTVVTFTPGRVLRKNTTYDILILGSSGSIVSNGVKNPAGEQMVNSYEWTFTTGNVDLAVPPPSSPLPALVIPIDPDSISISTESVGNDLSQVITITFPEPIDPATDLSQIKCSLQPILNDPTVRVPSGITTSVVIDGNQLKITMSGWPTSIPLTHVPFGFPDRTRSLRPVHNQAPRARPPLRKTRGFATLPLGCAGICGRHLCSRGFVFLGMELLDLEETATALPGQGW